MADESTERRFPNSYVEMEGNTEMMDQPCGDFLFLDYRNTPETRVLSFVLTFCKLNNFKVFLVKDNENEAGTSSEHCLPFEFSVVKKESLFEERKILCRLPALQHSQGKYWRAGLATIVRSIVKMTHQRDPEQKWDKLLGFRDTCLKACSEVSNVTKLCEVDFPEAVNAIEKEQFDLNCVSQMPVALARLENHLRKPPVLHNRRKHMKQHEKNGKKRDEVCYNSKRYFSGFELTLADLILLPSVSSILAVLEEKSPGVIRMIPHTGRWFNEVSSLKSVREALQKCRLNLPHDGCLQLDPCDTTASNLADELDFKLQVGEKKKTTGTKKIQHMNAKILPPILARLSEAGAMPQYSTHPCEDVSIRWEQFPSMLDPAGGELNPERAKRKRQQIENIYSVVRTMAGDGSVVVDFCSGGGHVGIVIAYFLTKCTVIMIENKEESIERARSRAHALGLQNVTFYQCNLDYFTGRFDIGVSLHACGLVTDMVMQKCFDNHAMFVICPCCYGAVCNTHTTTYPRSSVFVNEYEVSYNEYRVLGHAADQTSWDFDSELSVQGKHCMGLIDLDRTHAAKEHGYKVTLCTMQPHHCTPKNNLIIGLNHDTVC